MKFKPLGNRIIIYTDKEGESQGGVTKTKGGIYIPNNKPTDKQAIGYIGECGPLCQEVKVGDKVIYDKYAGNEVTIGDKIKDEDYKQLLILMEEDVSVIIEEEDDDEKIKEKD